MVRQTHINDALDPGVSESHDVLLWPSAAKTHVFGVCQFLSVAATAYLRNKLPSGRCTGFIKQVSRAILKFLGCSIAPNLKEA